MENFIQLLQERKIVLPSETINLIRNSKSCTVYSSVNQLAEASTGGLANNSLNVCYEVPGKGIYSEAIVNRVNNGISVNYTEPYMRRRDPDTMAVADDLPTDKARFADRFGYDFRELKEETLNWLARQDIAIFFFRAGREDAGVYGVAIVPCNAGFFAMALAMLQQIITVDELSDKHLIESVIYVAPPFRHTHFNGKQVVIHNRTEKVHEVYSYNLYPGPSAKKGLYGVLLDKGEKEGWITAHCSTVQVVSPYDNLTTFMHEGASGGGKSEMLQQMTREANGQIVIGKNSETGETRLINLPLFCSFNPVTDDMALCHPSYQGANGKLTVADAENAWFIRVDGIREYGSDPFLEKISINPSQPLLFLNIRSNPGSTALPWDHTEDAPGKPCSNPRVILPREIVPGVINRPVTVDIRSFGVRTPPSSALNPNYGIIGLFHILPPSLAWLWRLVAPRGHANPSITDSEGMASEGVGSYWPFATGKMVRHANLLLDQIISTPRMRYTLVPNQYIGVWKVGFRPQLIMREYLTRRGNAKLRPDQFQPARSPLLGYELNYLTLEGAKIPSRFLQSYRQPEMGTEGYDKGAGILDNFFSRELEKYLTPELDPTGRKIIEACIHGAGVEEYNELIPMSYSYSFLTTEEING
jgi:hypothetical protein